MAKIGSVWGDGTWADPAWEVDTWATRVIPTPAVSDVTRSGQGKGGSFWKTQHKIRMHDNILHREDSELMEIVAMIVKSGILDN